MKIQITFPHKYFVFLFLLLSGCSSYPEIAGIVKEEINSKPVAGAKVELLGTNNYSITDSSGRYNLKIENGKHYLVITQSGYFPSISSYPVAVGEMSYPFFDDRPGNFFLQKDSWEDIDINKIPRAEDYPESDAVFLLKETYLSLDRKSLLTTHIIAKIFKESAMELGRIVIPLAPEQELIELKARTVSADGKITYSKNSDIKEVSVFPGSIFYSDVKYKTFTMPSLENNCIIEYQYTVTSEAYPVDFVFDDIRPVMLSKFSLDVFPFYLSAINGTPFYMKMYNPRSLDIKQESLKIREISTTAASEIQNVPKQRKERLSFSCKNIPSIKLEDMMPPLTMVTSRIKIFPNLILPEDRLFFIGQSWERISKAYHLLIEKKLQESKLADDLFNQVFQNSKNKEDAIKKIYD